MATKLKILTILLLLSLTAFSQTGTNKKDICTISLSCITANKIATDLVRGDSAIAELQATQELLTLTKQKCAEQDTVIKSHEQKDIAQQAVVSSYKKKEENYQSINAGLEKDKKKLKSEVRLLGFTTGIASLIALISFLVP